MNAVRITAGSRRALAVSIFFLQITLWVVRKLGAAAVRTKMIAAIAVAVAVRRFNRIDGHSTNRIDDIRKLQGLFHNSEP